LEEQERNSGLVNTGERLGERNVREAKRTFYNNGKSYFRGEKPKKQR